MTPQEEWLEKYNKAFRILPKVGDQLVTVDGSPAKVIVKLETGKKPFLYALAFMPNIVGQELIWRLVPTSSRRERGLMCILCSPAASLLIRKNGLATEMEVQSVRVTKTGLRAVIVNI